MTHHQKSCTSLLLTGRVCATPFITKSTHNSCSLCWPLLKTPDAAPPQAAPFVKHSSPKLHTDFITWPPKGCLRTQGPGQQGGQCPGSAWERLHPNSQALPWPGHLHKLPSYRAQATASHGEMQARGTKSYIKMFCRTQGVVVFIF